MKHVNMKTKNGNWHKKLTFLKNKLNLSNETIASQIGVSLYTLKKWLMQKTVPSRLAYEKIEQVHREMSQSGQSENGQKMENHFGSLGHNASETILNKFRQCVNLAPEKFTYCRYLDIYFEYIRFLNHHYGLDRNFDECAEDNSELKRHNKSTPDNPGLIEQVDNIIAKIKRKFSDIIKEFPIEKTVCKYQLSKAETLILFKLSYKFINFDNNESPYDCYAFNLFKLAGIPESKWLENIHILSLEGSLQKNNLIKQADDFIPTETKYEVNKPYQLTYETANEILAGLIDPINETESSRKQMVLKSRPRFTFDDVILEESLNPNYSRF